MDTSASSISIEVDNNMNFQGLLIGVSGLCGCLDW